MDKLLDKYQEGEGREGLREGGGSRMVVNEQPVISSCLSTLSKHILLRMGNYFK